MNTKDCIFCKQTMEFSKAFRPNNEPGCYEGKPLDIYRCEPCQSWQYYTPEDGLEDSLDYYNFIVGQYKLCFNPNSKFFNFEIQYDPPDDPGNWDTILELGFLPNLTPQNTNVKRIKLFLLFS